MGDKPGHEFHGNQHSGSSGGSGSAPVSPAEAKMWVAANQRIWKEDAEKAGVTVSQLAKMRNEAAKASTHPGAVAVVAAQAGHADTQKTSAHVSVQGAGRPGAGSFVNSRGSGGSPKSSLNAVGQRAQRSEAAARTERIAKEGRIAAAKTARAAEIQSHLQSYKTGKWPK